MPTRRRLIVAGVITLVAGLVILFPARVAYDWFAPAAVRVGGISGSIWSGSASRASAGGIYVSNLQWRIKPLRLFTGKLAYAIRSGAGAESFEANLALSIGGDIYLTEMSADIPLQNLEVSSGVRGMRGTASARFERLVLSNGIPVAAKGTLEVSGLVLPLVSQSSIGDYRAEFFTQQDGVVASVQDTDGIVDLAGSLKLAADGAYEFLGQLAPKPETPPQLRQQLLFLGSANERGQYELRLEGRL